MFGMSSKEFWEEEPQLYWSYRTFYLQKIKMDAENCNYESWLKGSYNYIAYSVALNNALSKNAKEYPKEPLNGKQMQKENKELKEKMQKEKDKDVRQQIEYNFWARL